jgi:hypothetical protein
MNCKPGDLALVISTESQECRANIGAIVEVLRHAPAEACWIVRTTGRKLMAPAVWVPSGRSAGYQSFNEATCADKNLKPLRECEEEKSSFSQEMEQPA